MGLFKNKNLLCLWKKKSFYIQNQWAGQTNAMLQHEKIDSTKCSEIHWNLNGTDSRDSNQDSFNGPLTFFEKIGFQEAFEKKQVYSILNMSNKLRYIVLTNQPNDSTWIAGPCSWISRCIEDANFLTDQ